MIKRVEGIRSKPRAGLTFLLFLPKDQPKPVWLRKNDRNPCMSLRDKTRTLIFIIILETSWSNTLFNRGYNIRP